MRVRRDLLVHQPDLVIVEYAVNDADTREVAESYEGLGRQILSTPEQPALVLLFMTRQEGNSQEWEAQIGKHYSLPMVSVRDVVLPELKAGRLTWNELFADGVHPNDAGHALTADLLTSFFKMAYSKFTADKSSHSPIRVPPPLISDRFEHVLFLDRADLRPVAANGWKFNGANRTDLRWESSQPGSTIEFQIEGTDLYLYFWRVKGPMGKASVSVDGAAPTDLEAWFDQTWGGYRQMQELGKELKPGPHRVRVELLADKHPESTGTEFRVLCLGAAGVLPPAPAPAPAH